jgi:hypothetical protein
MRAKTINESISFERGKDPKKTLGIGITLEQELDEKFDEDNYNKIELRDIENGSYENELDIEKRVDHPMSGYQNSFNFCDYNVHLEKMGYDKYYVKIISQRGHGSIPKYLARQIEINERDFPDVDEYDNFNPKMQKAIVEEKTFSNLEDALEYIDVEFDFE